MKSLGEALHLDSGTLTPLLKKMEAEGLLTRSRAPEDERQLIIALTDKGEGLRQRALDIPGKVGKCIDIAPEDAAVLHRILHGLLASL